MPLPEGEPIFDSFDVPRPHRAEWVTIFDSPFYPDFLVERKALHEPTLIGFRDLVEASSDSADLLRLIMAHGNPLRTQLCRVFNKYVSPDTSVEMLKTKSGTEDVIRNFGDRFRPIEDVSENLHSRPVDDEPLYAILGEYDDRGKKGYDLTGLFFKWFQAKYEDDSFTMEGPVGAGSDIILNSVLPDYPHATPVDFLIRHKGQPICVGFVRYDSDRGGAQEDDRTKGNERNATQVLDYEAPDGERRLNVLFVNDGPGLLLGSMWRDYVRLERIDRDRVMVCTLLMLDHRLTKEWLLAR